MADFFLSLSDRKINMLSLEDIRIDFIDTSRQETYNIAKEINGKFDSNQQYDAIFINAEAKINGSNRSELKAVELIFWLRLKCNYTGPIVTYGFMSSPQILRLYPKYVVIYAPGNIYLRLGNELKVDDMPKSLVKNKVGESYRSFIGKCIDLEAVRHKEANWWGIYSLWKCHEVITKGRFKKPLPNKVQRELNTTNGFLIEKYYAVSDKRIQTEIENTERLKINSLKSLKGDIRILSKKINHNEISSGELENWVNELNRKINDIDLNWLPYLEGADKSQKEVEKKQYEKELIDVKDELVSCQNSINIHFKHIAELKNKKDNLGNLSTLEYLHNRLKIITPSLTFIPRILLIDDQASDGWSDIYQQIFYGKLSSEHFDFIQIDQWDSIDEIESKYTKKIKSYDIVFLDLRLLPNQDKRVKNDKEISGFKILKKIKTKYPEKIIVVTSASNKIWSYKEVLRMGADAYWIKEGVDNLLNAKGQLNNYSTLKKYVSVFASPEYKHYIEFSKMYVKLQKMTNLWWIEKDWKVNKIGSLDLNQTTKCSKEIVLNVYSDCLKHYKSYLVTKYITETYDNQDWFFYSNVILHLGKIIEGVHNLYTADFKKYGSFTKVIGKRNDKNGEKLYKKRNAAAHLGKSSNIDFDYFKNFVDDLTNYLSD